ncbi:hypothetical protein C8Q76DRAFT_734013 [Earliella scabrosa]|nr:hypothetical protein C8Q76DRAFT_734013 [Earliella scabrosa]
MRRLKRPRVAAQKICPLGTINRSQRETSYLARHETGRLTACVGSPSPSSYRSVNWLYVDMSTLQHRPSRGSEQRRFVTQDMMEYLGLFTLVFGYRAALEE